MRTQTHLGDPRAVWQAAEDGIESATASATSASATLAEAESRRRALLVPLGLIAVRIGLLYAKLRQLER